MGINYVDSVIVYNEYQSRTPRKQYYFGTRFDNVRIELTQGEINTKNGSENDDECIVKVPKSTWKKERLSPGVWKNQTTEEMLNTFTLNKGKDFFIIVKSEDLGVDIDLPIGMVDSGEYGDSGYFDFVLNKYGYAYTANKIRIYKDLHGFGARFEIGGK